MSDRKDFYDEAIRRVATIESNYADMERAEDAARKYAVEVCRVDPETLNQFWSYEDFGNANSSRLSLTLWNSLVGLPPGTLTQEQTHKGVISATVSWHFDHTHPVAPVQEDTPEKPGDAAPPPATDLIAEKLQIGSLSAYQAEVHKLLADRIVTFPVMAQAKVDDDGMAQDFSHLTDE